MTVPVHVVPDQPRHGVARFAGEVAGAVGACVVGTDVAAALPPTDVHLHVTDRLFGDTAERAAAVVTALAARHRATLTLHDLPQPAEGAAFAGRAEAYRAMACSSTGVVVSSRHEARLALDHLGVRADVVHLPVHRAPRARRRRPLGSGPPVIGLLGWVYPGKGHAEAVAAARGLPGPHVVRALGAVSPGHDHVVDEVGADPHAAGVELQVSGWVPDDDLPAALGDVDVPLAWHRHVSASGSINSWIAAGRRPVVPVGPYTCELDRLRPGTLTLADANDSDGLRGAIAAALDDPGSTWLRPGTDLRPGLPEVAAAYRRWWT